ncbi:hypothetical protein JCM8202_003444 [Rhodotorula sphaerocarpa]
MSILSTTRPRTAATTRPEPFLLAHILPHLLAPFPTALPPLVLSRSAQEAVHFLSLSPDSDEYWTLGRKDSQVALRRQELIEAGHADDLVLSPPVYAHDPEELRALILLSLPSAGASSSHRQPSLGVVLVWEETPSPLAAMHLASAQGAAGGSLGEQQQQQLGDDTRPGWTFLELQAVDGSPEELVVSKGSTTKRVWYPTVEGAEAASRSAASSEGAGASANGKAKPAMLDVSELGRDRPTGPGHYARDSGYGYDHSLEEGEDESYRDPAFGARPATTTNKKAPVADMADGEGTTPGAYGSPNDFWANWSDDEGEQAGRRGARSATKTPAREAEEADEAYWASYGDVDSVVGDDDAGARESGAAAELDAVNQAPSMSEPAPPVKTRTRRSSTVTPFQLGGFVADAPAPSAPPPAPAAAAAAVRTEQPAFPLYPPDVAALSDRLKVAQARSADSDDENDLDLRLALEGIWRMYVGRGKPAAGEIEEKKDRFRQVVAGVLQAEV